MNASTSSNDYLPPQIWAARYRQPKPHGPKLILSFSLRFYYQSFRDDAKLLSRVVLIPLRFQMKELPGAEIPVLGREKIVERFVQSNYEVMILEEGLP